MPAPPLELVRRWAVVAAAWLGGAGAALALHGSDHTPAPVALPRDVHDELLRTRREQTLLRAESTVRLLRVLAQQPGAEGSGP